MKNIMIISLNSGGTMGHGKIISSLANMLSKNNKGVTIVSDMPFSNNFNLNQNVNVENIERVPHANYTIGGMCVCSQKNEIFELAKKKSIECVIFSTFFDLSLVKIFKDVSVKTMLLSYPIRDTYRLALKQNGAYASFDRVITLYGPEFNDNVMSNERLVNPLNIVHNEALNSEENDICVTCGGGGRPSSKIFLRKVIRALEKILEKYPNMKTVIIKGNSKVEVNVSNMKIITWTKDFGGLISSSKLLVSEAGFFTMLDLINFKKRAILVPGERIIDNQELRALKLEELGIGRIFFPFEKVTKLSDMLKKSLTENKENEETFDKVKREFNKYPDISEFILEETK